MNQGSTHSRQITLFLTGDVMTGRGVGQILPHPISEKTIRVQRVKQSGDMIVASLHWGGNWGYDIPCDQIRFAHQLIDEAGVDVIHREGQPFGTQVELKKDRSLMLRWNNEGNDSKR